MCLGVVSDIISDGGSVVWACKEIPDPDRAREILSGISEGDYEKISIVNFADELPRYRELVISLSRTFSKRDIVIVDDWCDNHGRASKGQVMAVRKIADACMHTNLVITSSSYEDASGKSNNKWLSRGGDSVRKIFQTVFLERHPLKRGFRIIRSDCSEKLLLMSSRGLEDSSS
tara:strand:+ start:38259 stop:38780 length:522 start_codon:yes stop_codon:yes gene_type:complete